jgi:hypothetical protein
VVWEGVGWSSIWCERNANGSEGGGEGGPELVRTFVPIKKNWSAAGENFWSFDTDILTGFHNIVYSLLGGVFVVFKNYEFNTVDFFGGVRTLEGV